MRVVSIFTSKSQTESEKRIFPKVLNLCLKLLKGNSDHLGHSTAVLCVEDALDYKFIFPIYLGKTINKGFWKSVNLSVPFISIPDKFTEKHCSNEALSSLQPNYRESTQTRHQWHSTEILQREWQGRGDGFKGRGKSTQTERKGDFGTESKVRKNCRKMLSHPVLDPGKWQHTEKMKTAQHRPTPYCEANVEMSIFLCTLKLTWQLVASCYRKSEWLVLSFKL